MANCCLTEITFSGQQTKLALLEQKIKEWTSKDFYPNGWGGNWLGNICLGAGILSKEDMAQDICKYRCRGIVCHVELRNQELLVDTETAWVPMVKMWEAVLESLGIQDDVDFVYTATEEGCEVYWTNDPAMVGEEYNEHKYIYVPLYDPELD